MRTCSRNLHKEMLRKNPQAGQLVAIQIMTTTCDETKRHQKPDYQVQLHA